MYGRSPTKEELDAGTEQCAICQDQFCRPVILSCKVYFSVVFILSCMVYCSIHTTVLQGIPQCSVHSVLQSIRQCSIHYSYLSYKVTSVCDFFYPPNGGGLRVCLGKGSLPTHWNSLTCDPVVKIFGQEAKRHTRKWLGDFINVVICQ